MDWPKFKANARLDWIGSEEISDRQNISRKNIYRLEQRISTGKVKEIEMDERKYFLHPKL